MTRRWINEKFIESNGVAAALILAMLAFLATIVGIAVQLVNFGTNLWLSVAIGIFFTIFVLITIFEYFDNK